MRCQSLYACVQVSKTSVSSSPLKDQFLHMVAKRICIPMLEHIGFFSIAFGLNKVYEEKRMVWLPIKHD